ncbi:hypothetical protein P8452_44603 [Trifolium repens]|jgi:hypothetical protein|nr:hypothetical protein P8452_44603 [Trifolium repens]
MKLMSLFFFFCLFLLLFKTSFSTEVYARAKSHNLRSDSMSKFSPFHGKEGSRKNSGKQGSDEDVLGDEKRKVYTGPNPLHNR